MNISNRETVNGQEREMVGHSMYSVGDVIERWYILGEGGNHRIQYSPYCASRADAARALAECNFPYCPIGPGGVVFDKTTTTFTVRSPLPYTMIGERITVRMIGPDDEIVSYKSKRIESMRILDGKLADL